VSLDMSLPYRFNTTFMKCRLTRGVETLATPVRVAVGGHDLDAVVDGQPRHLEGAAFKIVYQKTYMMATTSTRPS
jgi:hypothetical protein